MNHSTPEQLIAELQGERLSDTQRVNMRARLGAYAAAHPARPSAWAFLMRHVPAVTTAVVMLLAGSTVALADRAQPDSLLYPIRQSVNEKFAVVVSGDEDAQMDTELEQLDRALNNELGALNREMQEQERGDTQEYSATPQSRIVPSDDDLSNELRAVERELGNAEQEPMP